MRLRILLGFVIAGLFLFVRQEKGHSFSTSFDGEFYTKYKVEWLAGVLSGHEEITRQAMVLVRQVTPRKKFEIIAPAFGLMGDLDPKTLGTAGSRTTNLVINGNFATDWPVHSIPKYAADLKKFWNIRDDLSLHTNPNLQIMHFLRNGRPDGGVMGAYKVCTLGREMIRAITIEGIRSWLKKDYPRAVFFFGHATHVLQDSFSSAHTLRDMSANSEIIDHCYYGGPQRKALQKIGKDKKYCYHKPIDPGDLIWLNAVHYEETKKFWEPRGEKVSACFLGLDNKEGLEGMIAQVRNVIRTKEKPRIVELEELEHQRESCLSHQARLAKYVTAKYLYLILDYLYDLHHGKLKEELIDSNGSKIHQGFPILTERLYSRFFEGPSGIAKLDVATPQGAIRCSRDSLTESFGDESKEYKTLADAMYRLSENAKQTGTQALSNMDCEQLKHGVNRWLAHHPLTRSAKTDKPQIPEGGKKELAELIAASATSDSGVTQARIRPMGEWAWTAYEPNKKEYTPGIFFWWQGEDKESYQIRIRTEANQVKGIGFWIPGPKVRLSEKDLLQAVYYEHCRF